jgi:membrane associated rhomboid family serine protease
MLPLRDNIPSRRYPVVTVLLIGLNLAAFGWELSLGRRLPEALLPLGIIPVRYTVREVAGLFSLGEQLAPFFTSMFLHGGWVHLLGNMWTLWVFGDNVEDGLGRGRYLVLYVFGGLAASLLHILTNPDSTVPTIGASGAIAAVMGAYFRLFPHAQVETLIPPFIFGPLFVVPAVVFLGWWFILQFLNGTLRLAADASALGGVAWWAHIGGFVFGAILGSLARPKRQYWRRYEAEDWP